MVSREAEVGMNVYGTRQLCSAVHLVISTNELV